MIEFNLNIGLPGSWWVNQIYTSSGKLPIKHKSWEFQICREPTLVSLLFSYTMHQDHAGLTIGLCLFSFALDFMIYDSRHWDYKTNTWEIYEDPESTQPGD
jgi:hypothetical protein